MANQEHLDILKQGVVVWNQWRRENPDILPDLSEARLEGFDLRNAHLEGTNLSKAYLGENAKSSKPLPTAKLQGAFFDKLTNLSGVILGNKENGFIPVSDVDWGGVNLTAIDWKQVDMIGDEFEALQRKQFKVKQLDLYQKAIHANRQLAITLQSQGLFDEGSRFAYNAHISEQKLMQLQFFLSLVQLVKNPLLARFAIRKRFPKSVYRLFNVSLSISLTVESLLFTFLHFPSLLIFPLAIFTYLVYLSFFKPLLRLTLFLLLALAAIISSVFYLFILILQNPVGVSFVGAIFSFLIGFIFRSMEPTVMRKERQRGNESIRINRLKLFLAQPYFVLANYAKCMFSMLLNGLAGYGYKPIRSLLCYMITVIGFTALYFVLGKLSIPDALVFSVTSFHGRGFFPGLGSNTPIDDMRVRLAALEAVVGLFIEISFIATFTQRFLGK